MPDVMPAIYTKSGLAGAALKAAGEAVHAEVRPESQWDLRIGWAAGATIADPQTEVQCSVAMPGGWTQTAEDPGDWAARQDAFAGDPYA